MLSPSIAKASSVLAKSNIFRQSSHINIVNGERNTHKENINSHNQGTTKNIIMKSVTPLPRANPVSFSSEKASSFKSSTTMSRVETSPSQSTFSSSKSCSLNYFQGEDDIPCNDEERKGENHQLTCESFSGESRGGLMMNRMVLDVIEWFCHKILVEETSLSKLCENFTQMGEYLSMFEDNEECIYSYGRLHSRLNLVALIYDVVSINRRHRDHRSDCDDSSADDCNFFSIHWNSDNWKRLEEQLVLAKCIMSCEDANRCILPSKLVASILPGKIATNSLKVADVEGNSKHRMNDSCVTGTMNFPSHDPNENDTSPLEKLDLFEQGYYELLRSLQVQAEISRLHQRLKSMQHKRLTKEDNDTNSFSFLKQVQNALDEYAGGLNKIFDDQKNINRSGQTPSDLIWFLLPELYQKNMDNLLDRLLKNLRSKVMFNDQNEFSYKRVQQKFRLFLIQWSNIVLDPPVLVQQVDCSSCKNFLSSSFSTYSDSSFMEGEEDFDEVSSWGEVDNGYLLRSFEEEETEQHANVIPSLVGTHIDIPSVVVMKLKTISQKGGDEYQPQEACDENIYEDTIAETFSNHGRYCYNNQIPHCISSSSSSSQPYIESSPTDLVLSGTKRKIREKPNWSNADSGDATNRQFVALELCGSEPQKSLAKRTCGAKQA